MNHKKTSNTLSNMSAVFASQMPNDNPNSFLELRVVICSSLARQLSPKANYFVVGDGFILYLKL